MSPKQRDSNMELLRIVAMFMVLVLHADFAALDIPSTEVTHAFPAWTGMRYVFETLSIACVNVFVLISGWFGIRPSVKGFGKFIFQALFFSLLFYGVACAGHTAEWSGTNWWEAVLFRHGLYWFIPAYIGLYLFSPVLNAFVEQASRKQFAAVLIAYFFFQWIYGFVFGEEPAFKYGYSLLSLMGLYLLARYIRIHQPVWSQRSGSAYAAMYVMCALAVALLGYLSAWYGIDGGQSKSLAYNNPLVIAESVALLLWFSKMRIASRAINWVSASAFSVFLMHLNPYFYFLYYKAPIQYLHAQYRPWVSLGSIVGFMVGIFVLAVLIDQVRKWIWRGIECIVFKSTNNG